MSKINKIQVENVVYDIEDKEIKSWARQDTKPTYSYDEITNTPDLSTKQDLITSENKLDVDLVSGVANVGKTGDYEDLSNTPTIPDVSNFITKDVNNLTNYELKTATGNNILVSIDSDTYVMTMSLRNSNNEVLNTQTVDLPLETMVVGGSYDNVNKKIVLTLKNGNTIDVPVGDLINGLQSEITSTNKLDASLVDDSLSTNKFVTTSEKTTWNAKEDTSNKVTTIDSTSDNTQYPGAKAVYDLISVVKGFGGELISNRYITLEGKTGIYLFPGATDTGFRVRFKATDQWTYINSVSPLFMLLFKDGSLSDEDETFGAICGITSTSFIWNVPILRKNGVPSLGEALMWTNGLLTSSAQSFTGVKTFSSIPKQANTTAPTQDKEFTNKKYVDDSIAAAITTTLGGSY